MAEVYVLPGVERRDLAGPAEGDAAHILAAAIENGVTEVVIVGKDRDGSQYVATSMGDADRAAGIMLRAATWLASVRIDNDVVIDTEEGA
ncbi:hypothetical protein V5F34_01000 [Xanthobacter autotrophicus]|uniref:hypothetical protein n=1 Tax=Xanthobacter autotrophicus TaxID=280 RepID=UPI00372CBD56